MGDTVTEVVSVSYDRMSPPPADPKDYLHEAASWIICVLTGLAEPKRNQEGRRGFGDRFQATFYNNFRAAPFTLMKAIRHLEEIGIVTISLGSGLTQVTPLGQVWQAYWVRRNYGVMRVRAMIEDDSLSTLPANTIREMTTALRKAGYLDRDEFERVEEGEYPHAVSRPLLETLVLDRDWKPEFDPVFHVDDTVLVKAKVVKTSHPSLDAVAMVEIGGPVDPHAPLKSVAPMQVWVQRSELREFHHREVGEAYPH